MFLPRVVTAIAGALTGARLARRIGTKQVYLAGLALSLAAMILLLVSAPVRTDQAWPTRCCWSPRRASEPGSG